MPAIAIDHHLNAANFRHNVGTLCKCRDCRLPACKHFIPMTSIGSDADWAAKMIEHDGCIRKCLCQVGQFGDLGMINPALERESMILQVRISSPEIGVQKKV